MLQHLETGRMYFRPLTPEDDINLFSLDSLAEVHTYLGNNPVKDINEARQFLNNVLEQYKKNGIGRMAAIHKQTGAFMGWAGLKVEHNVNGHEQFFDLGYRFLPSFWGSGYATEAAKAFVEYGFTVLKLEKINAYADAGHYASRRVLEKAGLNYVETFEFEGVDEVWYELLNPERR
ncbi:hypothetical protein CHU92_01530 [Flavobacterium cyanobacteriorum]|uniref:N-acetyltransferase domain-containing protein n=1 Tax=Flavobacterium cyanobacteriorum TaxID=2022802 RepID=A0A255ZY51_9FLAO|nr:GNAT family N-acetyltransferase [Flavobacterium cyanobacteriorum]OYQ46332.1 hypothetical protein CHU92_01530 [Flavobacterium cyanobacteriorum]